jgi:hypothetical protein
LCKAEILVIPVCMIIRRLIMRQGLALIILLLVAGAIVFTGCGQVDKAKEYVNIYNAPTGVVANATGPTSITVSWDEEPYACYNLFWNLTGAAMSNSSDADNSILDVETPYEHTGVSAGSTYYYVVTAINCSAKLESPPSLMVNATVAVPVPDTPTGLAAVANVPDKSITVSWLTEPSMCYNLFWNDTGAVITNASDADNSVLDTTSPYVHPGAEANTTYYYAVSAIECDLSAESEFSSMVNSTIDLVPPTGLVASDTDPSITVSWDTQPSMCYNLYWNDTGAVITNASDADNSVLDLTPPYEHTGDGERDNPPSLWPGGEEDQCIRPQAGRQIRRGNSPGRRHPGGRGGLCGHRRSYQCQWRCSER